jgi:hypothetical protein
MLVALTSYDWQRRSPSSQMHSSLRYVVGLYQDLFAGYLWNLQIVPRACPQHDTTCSHGVIVPGKLKCLEATAVLTALIIKDQ